MGAQSKQHHISHLEVWESVSNRAFKCLEAPDQREAQAFSNIDAFNDAVETIANKISRVPECSTLHTHRPWVSEISSLPHFAQSHLGGEVNGFVIVVHCYLLLKLSIGEDELDQDEFQRSTLYFEPTMGFFRVLGQQVQNLKIAVAIKDIVGIPETIIDTYKSILEFFSKAVETFRGGSLSSRPLRAEPITYPKEWQQLEELFNIKVRGLEDRIQHLARLRGSEIKYTRLQHTHEDFSFKTSGANEIDQRLDLPCRLLPKRYPKFFGRKEIIEEIDKVFDKCATKPELGAVALYGLAGIGKTQIALVYAHSTKKTCSVFWANAQDSTTLEQDFSGFARELKLTGASKDRDEDNSLIMRKWLANTESEWLLVFDNAEDPDLLDEYWPETTRNRVLVTTINPNLTFGLTAREIQVPVFDEQQSLDFLRMLLRLGDDADQEDTKKLVSRLDGLPLGLNQMAAYMHSEQMSVKRFLSLYLANEQELHAQKERGATGSDYSKTVHTVWTLSFNSLNESAKTIMGVVGFLPANSITRKLFFPKIDPSQLPKDLQFCCKEIEFSRPEKTIIKLSLIQKNLDGEELSVHRLVQSEFHSYLSLNDRQRIFELACWLVYQAFPHLVNGRPMHSDWPRCGIYLSHVNSLNQHFSKRNDDGSRVLKPTMDYCELLCNVAWYLKERDKFTLLKSVLQLAFEAYNECTDKKPEDELVFAHLTNSASARFINNGDFKACYKANHTALRIRTSLLEPNHEEIANSYNNLGNACHSLCLYWEAIVWQRKALEIRSRWGQTWSNAVPLSHLDLGRSIWALGLHELALKHFNHALRLFKLSGNWYLESQAHLVFGAHYLFKRELVTAKYHFKCSVDIEESNSKSSMALATAYYKLGLCFEDDDNEHAIETLKKSLEMGQENFSNTADIARILHVLSRVQAKVTGLEQEAEKNRIGALALRKAVQGKLFDESKDDDVEYDRLVLGFHR